MSVQGKVEFISKNPASDTEFDAAVVVSLDATLEDGIKNGDDGTNQLKPFGISNNPTNDGETQAVSVMPLHTSAEPRLKFSAALNAGAEVSYSIVAATRGQGKAAASGDWVIGTTKKAVSVGEIAAIDAVEPYEKT